MSMWRFTEWLESNGFEYRCSLKPYAITGRDGVVVEVPNVAPDVDRHYRLMVVSNFGRVDGRVRVRYGHRERLLKTFEVCKMLEKGVWS